MSIEVSGLVGILVLIADIWALVHILSSPAAAGEKVAWTLLVVLLPVIGLLLWFFLGPRQQQVSV